MSNNKQGNLNKHYLEDHSKSVSKHDVERLNKKKRRLQKILSLKAFTSHKQKLKLFIEILKNYQKGSYRSIPWKSIAAITFTLLYIINPFDIVPDILPIVGYVDDVSVFMTLLALAEKDLDKFEKWKAKKGLE